MVMIEQKSIIFEASKPLSPPRFFFFGKKKTSIDTSVSLPRPCVSLMMDTRLYLKASYISAKS